VQTQVQDSCNVLLTAGIYMTTAHVVCK